MNNGHGQHVAGTGRAEQTTARVSKVRKKRGVHQPKRPASKLLHEILRVVRVFLKPLGLLLHAFFYFQNSSRFRLVLQGKRPLVVKCQSTEAQAPGTITFTHVFAGTPKAGQVIIAHSTTTVFPGCSRCSIRR